MAKQERFIPVDTCDLHLREAAEGEQSRMVAGTPIVFGERSVNLVPWSSTREIYEVLEPGCITQELIERSDVVLNLNHSTMVTDVLGRSVNGEGTLKLILGRDGVRSECELPKTSAANDTLELIKRGDITGMSFAFEDDDSDSENGVSYERIEERNAEGKDVWLRHVKKINRLHDVSIVTHPAYQQTSVSQREIGEKMLREIDAAVEQPIEEKPTAEEAAAREARRRETETLLLT